MQVDTFNLVVLLGLLDRGEDVVQAIALHIGLREQEVEGGAGTTTFVDYAIEVERHYGVVVDLCLRFGRRGHAEDHQHTDKEHHDRGNDEAYYRGKGEFQKIFHTFLCFNYSTF